MSGIDSINGNIGRADFETPTKTEAKEKKAVKEKKPPKTEKKPISEEELLHFMKTGKAFIPSDVKCEKEDDSIIAGYTIEEVCKKGKISDSDYSDL